MRLIEIMKLVLMNLRQNKVKVFLTSLGIIVGAATIVLVIAIGEGGIRDVEEQFKNLNAGTITVSASSQTSMGGPMAAMGGSSRSSGGGMSSGGDRSGGGGMPSGMSDSAMMGNMAAMLASQEVSLTEETLENLLYFVPDIATGAIMASEDLSVFGGTMEEESTYTVLGTQAAYQEISNLDLLVGTFLTEEDEENETRCAVLGYSIAAEMFDSVMDAYDSKIEIDGRTYIVNGVLNSMGAMVSGISPDTCIFVPYSTAQKYVFDREYTPQISLLASDVNSVESVMSNTALVLEQDNPNATFAISDAGSTMDAALASAETLSLLLMAVAAIVFLVGGIGIMNGLFVSVKERTREIGVLRAIGTKKRDILLLFLVEANAMGMIGGILGVLLSFALLPLLEYFQVSAVFTPYAAFLAFAFAVVTGTLFGLYPAWQASNLLPIKALQNE